MGLSIVDVSGLGSVEHVGSLEVLSCPLLESFNGFEGVTSSLSFLVIGSNPMLADISSLYNLSDIEGGGISGNTCLSDDQLQGLILGTQSVLVDSLSVSAGP